MVIHSHFNHLQNRRHNGVNSNTGPSRKKNREYNRQPNFGPSYLHSSCNHLVGPEFKVNKFVADKPPTPDCGSAVADIANRLQHYFLLKPDWDSFSVQCCSKHQQLIQVGLLAEIDLPSQAQISS